ncbi:protein kinase [Angomonas deanei]|nr:protein kinase [Angomonas deanei]|eukprot:EPY25404.1 protein kinase [Angomonas deanei]
MLQTSNAAELRTWRKGSIIGKGTYGSVYLGLLPDGSFYAVKVVELGRKTETFDVRELVSLSREINMMQRLQHRNLCTFKGVAYDPHETSICMFMEYIGGGSLSSVVKKFKPLPDDVVRQWTMQLLSGLLYLHTQNIIHRDIKGDNVLVDTSAGPKSGAQIKLVDFGAAKRVTDAVGQSRTVIGTPYWMAPEVVNMSGNDGGYSYKADVWSVGCTVAEMLTGKPPWPSKANAPSAIMMIATSTGMPTEIPEKEATPGCLDFMKCCFEREPDKRPTVEELLQHPWILGQMK